MDTVTLLNSYRAYLETLDEELTAAGQADSRDFLSPGEVLDLLVIRDELSTLQLDSSRRRELERLDCLLLKHREVITENIPHFSDKPREHWWWHLHEDADTLTNSWISARLR